MHRTQNRYLIKPLLSEKTVFNGFHPIQKIFFLFLMVLSHNVLFAEERDSVEVQQRNKTIFFVSENTIVHGTVFFAEETSKTPVKVVVTKKKWKAKPKTRGIAEQLKLKKSRDAQLVQKIKDQIKSRKGFNYTPSSDQQLTRLDQYQKGASANAGNSNPVFLSSLYYLPILKMQIAKQQFYSSVSFLQFSRLLDSFLRGPPALS